jgi:hypothetical protein
MLHHAWCECVCLVHAQIRVVNAFRMGADVDSFDKRSLSSLHSHHSVANLRLAALRKSMSGAASGDDQRV